MVIGSSELGAIRREYPESTIAVRLGCYDLLHTGHKEGLTIAAQQAGILVVGIVPDEIVRQLKGPERPINPQDYRAQAIDIAAQVDYTFVLPNKTTAWIGLVSVLGPDVYVRSKERGSQTILTSLLDVLGDKLVIDPGDKLDSTTSMLSRLGLLGAQQASIKLS